MIPIFHGECGDCVYCHLPNTNMCEMFGVNPMRKEMPRDGKVRFWTKDRSEPIFHFLNTSTFSEYTIIESSCVVKIDPGFPLKKLCLVSCGVSTGTPSIPLSQNPVNVQEGEKKSMLYVPDFEEEFTFSFSWLLIFIGGPILPSFAF